MTPIFPFYYSLIVFKNVVVLKMAVVSISFYKMKKLFVVASFSLLLSWSQAVGQEKLYGNQFPLGDVVITGGLFQKARDLNIETLLKYNVDRLLAPYRKEAGLAPKDSSYQNWDGLDGHVGGHYLTAMALNYAATGNAACKQRMNYMVAELKTCQEANAKNNAAWGVGYLGGVPNSKVIWPALKAGNHQPYKAAWVPWYNLHKTYAGLRDAWLYGRSEVAKTLFLRFCNWGINITAPLDDEQMQAMLDVEHGGMNEMFADAYQITGDKRYLQAAKRFSHRMLLNPMADGKDNLDNKHANTQAPKAIGFQRIGELSGEDQYEKGGRFFWETVTSNRTLAFGGNSRREFFPAGAASSDFINDVEGPESCNTYNMLKLSQGLFRQNPSARFMDYYERAVYNHILSTQHPEHGGYVYFTPVRPRHYRVYSAPNQAMWCCVGSGMENHGKYNEAIYTHQSDSLFVNLFIPSELNWKSRGITLRQETNFPDSEKTRLQITKGSARFPLLIRYPSWVKPGAMTITVNGKTVPATPGSSSYVAITRQWKKGDLIAVTLPMQTTVEHLPNLPEYVALLHGPIVLGAKTGAENLRGLVADDSRWGHIAGGERLPIDKAPIIVDDNISGIASRLQPVKGKPLHFSAAGLKMINGAPVDLQPFYQIHDSRYMVYWMALTNQQYRSYLDSLAAVEKTNLELQQRTVDFVAPGEQQPEADHRMEISGSRTGSFMDQFYRDAENGGYFSYGMTTNGETNLALLVKYWGAEWGNRKFDIFIDDKKLVTEDNTGRWNQSKFQHIEYKIPEAILKGKRNVRVKFQAHPGSTAGGVFYVRLVKAN